MGKIKDDMIARRGPITRYDIADVKHELVNAANMCFAAFTFLAKGRTDERLDFAARAESNMREVFEMVEGLYQRQKTEEFTAKWQSYYSKRIDILSIKKGGSDEEP